MSWYRIGSHTSDIVLCIAYGFIRLAPRPRPDPRDRDVRRSRSHVRQPIIFMTAMGYRQGIHSGWWPFRLFFALMHLHTDAIRL